VSGDVSCANSGQGGRVERLRAGGASILGLLLIFRSTLGIITSARTRWLGMVAGILEVLLGFWASQQYLPVRGALLLIWVGFFALFRGISEIVIAFELRRAQHP
jgi:uncharacterized membrane protein HdeD (DUF308 family)